MRVYAEVSLAVKSSDGMKIVHCHKNCCIILSFFRVCNERDKEMKEKQEND